MIIFDREFKNPLKTITAFNNEEFKKAFEEIELLRKTHILAGYVRYEAKEVFLNRPVDSDAPLLYFEVFEAEITRSDEDKLLRADSSGIPQDIAKTPGYNSLPHKHCEVYPHLSYLKTIVKNKGAGNSVCSDYGGDLIEQKIPLPAQDSRRNQNEKQNSRRPVPCNEYIFPTPSINYEEFASAIGKIKDEIAQGNTYEVNYTYNHEAEFFGDSYNLFLSLLREQKTPYNAFILNNYEEILSFSPELFFELEKGRILTKPMKGTVKRADDPEKDEENKIFLKNDLKNRAENVMIVDLLRNDLGQVAKTGSVEVTKLFEIETHKTLHQMTSQIEAEVKNGTTLYEIFKAIFPCGSITGAPKISTMEIIEKVEKGKRDVYCGAIGVISPEKTVFSVPIRILQRKKGETAFKYRVGGAIVWDSTPEDEWEETIVKSKFLTANHAGLKLIETVKIEDGKAVLGQEHFFRMKNSAQALGFAFDGATAGEIFGVLHLGERGLTPSPQPSPLRGEGADFYGFGTLPVASHTTNFSPNDEGAAAPVGWAFSPTAMTCLTGKIPPNHRKTGIMRVLLSKNGEIETSFREADAPKSFKIAVSSEKVNSHEPLLMHKTTYRPHFEAAFEKIKNGEIYDEIFFNEKGELTEGARSNIVIEKDGKFYTPPVECGLLKGIFRQKLIKEGKCTEKILKMPDLEAADAIFCVNSVRGMVKVCF